MKPLITSTVQIYGFVVMHCSSHEPVVWGLEAAGDAPPADARHARAREASGTSVESTRSPREERTCGGGSDNEDGNVMMFDMDFMD